MIAKIWYIREISDRPGEYIYRDFDIPYVLPDKSYINDEYGEIYKFEEPSYNVTEGRLEFILDSISYSEIGSYTAIGWKHYEVIE